MVGSVEIIISILLAVATGFAALAALLSWTASKEHTKTLVRPHILVYPSEMRHRVALAQTGELLGQQVKIPGIRVNNVGLGPAIRGIIYLVEGQKEVPIKESEEQYSFYRIPPGQDFFFPSRDSPILQNYLTESTESIRIRVVYYDVLGNRYTFPTDSEGYSEVIRF